MKSINTFYIKFNFLKFRNINNLKVRNHVKY